MASIPQPRGNEDQGTRGQGGGPGVGLTVVDALQRTLDVSRPRE